MRQLFNEWKLIKCVQLASLLNLLCLLLSCFPTQPAYAIAPQEAIGPLNVPFYSQTALRGQKDAHGSEYLLGSTTGSPLWRYGCGVASLAMVYRFFGQRTSLVDLNETLQQTKGLTGPYLRLTEEEGRMNIAKAGSPAVHSILLKRPNGSLEQEKEQVDAALKARRPVIAYIGGKHFVVITGKNEQGEYLINDPWLETEATGKNILFSKNAVGMEFSSITEFIWVNPLDTAPTNGYTVSGRIAEAYYAQGGAKGPLGAPASEENAENLYEGEYLWQAFEQGMILQVGDRAYSIYGPFYMQYRAFKGEEYIGVPLNNAYFYHQGPSTIHQQDFERGSILWNEKDPMDKAKLYRAGEALQVEYFDNPELEGEPVLTSLSPDIQVDWKDGKPIPEIQSDRFSVRWTENFEVGFLGWWYIFTTRATGSYRIVMDGKTIRNAWGQVQPETFTQFIGRGKHTLMVEFSKDVKTASIAVERTGWPGWAVHVDEGMRGAMGQLPVAVDDFKEVVEPTQVPTPDSSATPLLTTPSPEEPVRLFFEALNRRDTFTAAGAFKPSTRLLAQGLLEVSLTGLEQAGQSMSFSNLNFTIRSEEVDKALVDVNGVVTLSDKSGSETSSQEFTFQISVDFVDGRWLISSGLDELASWIKELE